MSGWFNRPSELIWLGSRARESTQKTRGSKYQVPWEERARIDSRSTDGPGGDSYVGPSAQGSRREPLWRPAQRAREDLSTWLWWGRLAARATEPLTSGFSISGKTPPQPPTRTPQCGGAAMIVAPLWSDAQWLSDLMCMTGRMSRSHSLLIHRSSLLTLWGQSSKKVENLPGAIKGWTIERVASTLSVHAGVKGELFGGWLDSAGRQPRSLGTPRVYGRAMPGRTWRPRARVDGKEGRPRLVPARGNAPTKDSGRTTCG